MGLFPIVHNPPSLSTLASSLYMTTYKNHDRRTSCGSTAFTVYAHTCIHGKVPSYCNYVFISCVTSILFCDECFPSTFPTSLSLFLFLWIAQFLQDLGIRRCYGIHSWFHPNLDWLLL